MNIDTASYFLIILEGFGLVWSYRRATKSQKDISDFEYLGFSAFWGVVLLGIWQSTSKNIEQFNELLKNPYVMGAILFVLAAMLGTMIGYIVKETRLAYGFLQRRFGKKVNK